MVRKPRGDGRGVGGSEANDATAVEWFANVSSDVATCDEWDCKPGLLDSAVMLLLSKARGIVFSLSWDQTHILVTVLDGDRKQRVKVNDAIEFEEVLTAVCERAATLGKLPKREWEAR